MHSSNPINSKRDVWISKTLSWLLRHGALKEGLTISTDGFLAVSELLNCKCLKAKCTIDDVKRIVANNDKQRFALRTTQNGVLEIRANQGHSISGINNLELIPIDDSKKTQNVIHGTYFKFWESIKKQGLYRGTRNHIHFATGLPKDSDGISGIRKTAEIYIFIDLAKALSARIQFFLSTNGVILSPGNNDGYIKPEYFLKVCRASDNSELTFLPL